MYIYTHGKTWVMWCWHRAESEINTALRSLVLCQFNGSKSELWLGQETKSMGTAPSVRDIMVDWFRLKIHAEWMVWPPICLCTPDWLRQCSQENWGLIQFWGSLLQSIILCPWSPATGQTLSQCILPALGWAADKELTRQHWCQATFTHKPSLGWCCNVCH